MARSYSFDCPKCGYSAKVCGGRDCGLHCAVKTFVCRDCRSLHDVTIHARAPLDAPGSGLVGTRLQGMGLGTARLRPLRAGAANTEANRWRRAVLTEPFHRLPPTGSGPLTWIELAPRCPVSEFHRLEPWSEPGRCPRCRTFLEKSLLPFRVWE